MAEANGKLRPEWANGALLPAPLNDSELFELMEQTSGLVLEDGHVLMRRRDVHLLRQALGRSTVIKEVVGALEMQSSRAWSDSDPDAEGTNLSSSCEAIDEKASTFVICVRGGR